MKKLMLISILLLTGCTASPYTQEKFTQYELDRNECVGNDCYFTNDIQRQVNITSFIINNKRPK